MTNLKCPKCKDYVAEGDIISSLRETNPSFIKHIEYFITIELYPEIDDPCCVMCRAFISYSQVGEIRFPLNDFSLNSGIVSKFFFIILV